jgi:hypothetical protein
LRSTFGCPPFVVPMSPALQGENLLYCIKCWEIWKWEQLIVLCPQYLILSIVMKIWDVWVSCLIQMLVLLLFPDISTIVWHIFQSMLMRKSWKP